MLDQRHALYRLAGKIDWEAAEARFGGLYTEEGRPGIPIRLMVGLHYLKHTFDESDESVVARWVENPYWQYFCGEEYFRHIVPIDPGQMTRFRDRVGAEGCEYMLSLTVRIGLDTKTVSSALLSVVNVDTTVQGFSAIRCGTLCNKDSDRHTMRIHGQMYLGVEPPFVRPMS
ncbi:transposase, IS5 family [Nitrosospira multiformis]|uniref:Transposase, IS5 family n=1 Tax=Nitrosospira multiformis TaxID=1231 RepID=A0A1I7FH07_9PROT|nr:transposase, IS5 family [Nitrosospira multiformis]